MAFVISRQSIGELNISVLSADGTLRELQSGSSQPSGPTWSPDGAKLAFSMIAPPKYFRDIYIMDSDGSDPINLTNTPEYDELFPAFSPNGSQICFAHYNPNRQKQASGIYVIDADGSDSTPLANEHMAGPCDWSPDGTKIAFTYAVGGTEEIYVMNADGSGQTNLTRTNDNWESDPDWSPYGTRIAFEGGRAEDFDIYTMDPDGSDVEQVTHSGPRDMDPDWQPLPRFTSPKDVADSDVAQATKDPGVDGTNPDRQAQHEPTEAKPEKQQEERQQNQQQQHPQHSSKSRSVTVHPPDTGGPSLLLIASALLFSGSVLLYVVVRRIAH